MIRKSFIFILVSILTYSLAFAQKKPGFEYPEDVTSDSSKKAFAKQFNQGLVLYQVICAKCHNITEGKKEVIPDFSLTQLMDYKIRIYPQHQEELGDLKMTHEELDKIIAFLRYKTKTGRPVAVSH